MRAASRVKAGAVMVMAAARSSPAAGRRCGRGEAAALPGVSQVVPNAVKDRLVAEVLGLPLDEFELEPLERVPVPGARSSARAPSSRCRTAATTAAPSASRRWRAARDAAAEAAEVLAEIRAVSCHAGQEVTTAVQEAVLTGVHLGSWGQDLQPGRKLGELVRLVLERNGAAAPAAVVAGAVGPGRGVLRVVAGRAPVPPPAPAAAERL